MASITDHVIKLQELTQTNLDILQTINDAFFAKQNHLSVKIGDANYAVPSFISLENKLDALTANFENLVKAPESGEAYFNFDGNSRSIQVRPYTNTPNSLVLTPVNMFDVDKNDIFKDFMTPTPFVNINVQDLPNDIVNVMVKKVVPINPELVSLFESQLTQGEGEETIQFASVRYPFKDLYKKLSIYEQDIDYIEYDTKIALPVRKNIGSGVYVIESVIDDIINENLDNYITIKFRSDMQDSIYMNALKYRLFDETIERMLKVGDCLTTYDGSAKVEITEIRTNTNTVVVKVLHGEYLNLVPTTSNNPSLISSLSKMRFYSPIDFNEDKFVKVPLEEDQYVFIAVAALNDRMNIQSAWGSGLLINTDQLKNINDLTKGFREHYNENVKNVGDILFEITSMMGNTITQHTKSEFDSIIGYVPEINTDNLQVLQINKHLNDSESVKNIRALYSQKKNLQLQLDQVQGEINSINEELSTVSFDDTTGIRTAYTSQLTALTNRRNDISASITMILNDISVAANNSEVPIENAKYRIRGFYSIDELEHADHIKGIRVQYRYKNVDQETGNAVTIGKNFVFSDWINMNSFDRQRIPSYNSGYKFAIQLDNGNVNEPSFNQIDIPISQGETVDIRLKVVYDYGSPFIHTESAWSPIVNIAFPEEYLRDIQLLDILDENNKDIESNKFTNLIKTEGITAHVEDKMVDQDITYFHNPENIASGFYTAERRIIPLKDKLTDLNNAIAELKDEILGSSSEALTVSVILGEEESILTPYQTQRVLVEPYSTFKDTGEDNSKLFEGLYTKETNGLVITCLNISIANHSDHTVKLFSMFPGSRDKQLYDLVNFKHEKSDYCGANENGEMIGYKGIWFEHPKAPSSQCSGSNESGHTSHSFEPADTNTIASIQGGNQYMYFRTRDVHDGTMYYKDENSEDQLSWNKGKYKYNDDGAQLEENTMYLYPKLQDRYGLCLDTDIKGSYIVLAPGDEIIVPIVVEYYVGSGTVSKTLSFDLLPSLYRDPVNYSFKVIANTINSSLDKVIAAGKNKFNTLRKNIPIRYQTKIK